MKDSRFIEWFELPVCSPDEQARQGAEQRQNMLTKPPGALGSLEMLAVKLAALQGRVKPCVAQIQITVFAADHGVAVEGVSAFPQSVTVEMIKNFVAGGAAINVAARTVGAKLDVINLGTVHAVEDLNSVKNCDIGPGTANFIQGPAMSQAQMEQAMSIGCDTVNRAHHEGIELFVGGEMGIANTTSATAISCALLDTQVRQIVGPGTGLDEAGVEHKVDVIQQALVLHRQQLNEPLGVLRCLGGFEIAALAGAYLRCAQLGLPVLIDGFICSVAALLAVRFKPDVSEWLLFSHVSAEPGHRRVLQAMQAQPLLDLGMRLGEGSGAAVAIPLLQMACNLHNEMATFSEAGVSGKL